MSRKETLHHYGLAMILIFFPLIYLIPLLEYPKLLGRLLQTQEYGHLYALAITALLPFLFLWHKHRALYYDVVKAKLSDEAFQLAVDLAAQKGGWSLTILSKSKAKAYRGNIFGEFT